MRSMTGFGRGKATQDGCLISVEISSVNRKNLDVSVSLPRAFGELEPRLRDEISSTVSRGRLNVAVAWHGEGKGTSDRQAQREVRVDMAAAKKFADEMRKLAGALQLSGDLTLEVLARAPGVVVEQEVDIDVEAFWGPLSKALQAALKQLLVMRKKEGAALARDLRQRVKRLQNSVSVVKRRAPHVMKAHRQALCQRVQLAGVEIDADDERLLKELVFFADRSDISEELTRLSSHFTQFLNQFGKDRPVGRTLDFLIQEMGREVNTIGSKANDIEISQEVVSLKTELEKIREQVQNIE